MFCPLMSLEYSHALSSVVTIGEQPRMMIANGFIRYAPWRPSNTPSPQRVCSAALVPVVLGLVLSERPRRLWHRHVRRGIGQSQSTRVLAECNRGGLAKGQDFLLPSAHDSR